MTEAEKGPSPGRGDAVPAVPETAKPSVNECSQALADFLQVVGESVADLNTIAVGLAAITQDHQKPEGLNISWNPKDPVIAARKARKAAVHAAMVVSTEALGQYVRAVTNLPRFNALTKAWAERKPKKASAAERVSELAAQVFTGTGTLGREASYDTRYRTCCVMLMIHWRNHHVHTDSAAKLTHHEKQVVRANEERIAKEYAGLSVDRLFADFDANRPTLKDATTLIAMTILDVRAIDKALYVCRDFDDVKAWLEHYKLTERIEKIERETAPAKQRESIVRMLQTNAPQLVEWYKKFVPDPRHSH